MCPPAPSGGFFIGGGGEPPPLPPPGGGGGGLAPPLLPGPAGPPGSRKRRKREAPGGQKRHAQHLQKLIDAVLNLKPVSSRFRREVPPQANPFANFTTADFMMLDLTSSWQQGIMEQEKTCQFLSIVDHEKFNSAHQCAKLRSLDENCAEDFLMLKEVLSQDPPKDLYQQIEKKMCGPECAGAVGKLGSIVECNALDANGAPLADVLIGTLLTQITSGQDYSQTCSDLRNVMLCPLKKMDCCQILIDQLYIALSQSVPVQLLDLCNIKYEAEHCREKEKEANLIGAGSTLQFSVVTMTVAALLLVLTR